MTSIHDYWPFKFEQRTNQTKALDWLEQNKDKKYFILESPVGSGKSFLGLAFSRYLSGGNGNAFILTPQKILQKQYENEMSSHQKLGLVSFYGKSNYRCKEKNTNCEIGQMLKPKCNFCPFTDAKGKAKSANNTVMNYTLALLNFGFTKTFEKKRKLMVLDECHQLEGQLVEFDAITISEKKATKYNVNWVVNTEFNQAVDWVNTKYLPAAKQYLVNLYTEVEPLLDKSSVDLTNAEIKKISELEKIERHISEISGFIKEHKAKDLRNEFVLVHDKTSIKFKRLTGKFAFKHFIEPSADKFLFMSSTVLDKQGFCADLGLDPEQTCFLQLDSEFEPKNRPVFYIPTAKMNSKWNTDENIQGRNNLIKQITEICDMHDGDSGIIHTANFAISQWLVNQLNKKDISQYIFHHNPDSGDSRDSVIDAFISNTTPGLLISPSSTEGLDLKHKLARFAIFAKVPYGYLGDQWIRRRMQMSNEWYQRRALIDIIQGGGRIVRDKSDWGNVYILDTNWNMLFTRNQNMIPKWWMQSYRTLNQ